MYFLLVVRARLPCNRWSVQGCPVIRGPSEVALKQKIRAVFYQHFGRLILVCVSHFFIFTPKGNCHRLTIRRRNPSQRAGPCTYVGGYMSGSKLGAHSVLQHQLLQYYQRPTTTFSPSISDTILQWILVLRTTVKDRPSIVKRITESASGYQPPYSLPRINRL